MSHSEKLGPIFSPQRDVESVVAHHSHSRNAEVDCVRTVVAIAKEQVRLQLVLFAHPQSSRQLRLEPNNFSAFEVATGRVMVPPLAEKFVKQLHAFSVLK